MIRVLRVLEYEYDNIERYLDDISKFTTNLNIGSMRMQSSIVSTKAIVDNKGEYKEVPPGSIIE